MHEDVGGNEEYERAEDREGKEDWISCKDGLGIVKVSFVSGIKDEDEVLGVLSVNMRKR